MICSSCGKDISWEVKFCPFCGTQNVQVFINTNGPSINYRDGNNEQGSSVKTPVYSDVPKTNKTATKKSPLKLIISLSMAAIATILIIALNLNSPVRGMDLESYNSKTEMLSAVNGSWIAYVDGRDTVSGAIGFNTGYSVISEDKITHDDLFSNRNKTIKSWNPKKGFFSTTDNIKYGVKRGGREIVWIGANNSLVFIKEIISSPNTTDLVISNLEKSQIWSSGPTGSEIVEEYVSDFINGSITNHGKVTYKYIELEFIFFDEADSVIETAKMFVVCDEGLMPGESINFEMRREMSEKSRTLGSYRVSVISSSQ